MSKSGSHGAQVGPDIIPGFQCRIAAVLRMIAAVLRKIAAVLRMIAAVLRMIASNHSCVPMWYCTSAMDDSTRHSALVTHGLGLYE